MGREVCTPTAWAESHPRTKAGCDVVWQTSPGEAMYWSHYAYNEHDNRWYYVRYTIGNGTPHTFYGWIYCGNVTAPC